MSSTHVLELCNVTKMFGKFTALNNVTFSVTGGRILGLLGKNGAGKTTLFKTILGLLKKQEGQIHYEGKPLDTNNPVIMCTIGSLVDTAFHEDLTAFENIKLLMMASPADMYKNPKNEIYQLLELVDLKKNAQTKVKSFSFGMKQRLALAQALMGSPRLLMLDEPFVGLDPLGIELVKSRLLSLCRETGLSIIFSSHQLAEVAEISDDIVVINGGEVGYCGTYEQLVNGAKKYHICLRRAADKKSFENLNVSLSKGMYF